MSTNSNFQQHIHVFRAIAIILIVCAHAVPSIDWTINPLLGRIIDGIANEASILFFFIAGYLFQHLSGRFQYVSYLQQKVKTVILPYLILSIPALIVFTSLTQRTGMWPWFYELPVWQQIGLFLLTGKHLAPLWFVPTIAIFYIFAPLFIKIDRQAPKIYWVIVPLLALSVYLGRSGPYGPIDKALYLLPIYLLGMAFSHFKTEAQKLVTRFWPVLMAIMLLGFFGFIYEWPQPPYYLMVVKVPMALLLTLALLKWGYFFGKRLDYIAEVSFGIFFVHAYFISALKVVSIYLLEGRLYLGEGASVFPGTLPVFFAYVVVVLIFSVFSIWCAQNILGKKSRMFVGA